VVANLTFLVFNNSDGDSLLNSTASLLVDLNRISVSFRLSPAVVSSQNVNKIIQGSVDTCKVQKGIFGNFLIKMIQDSMAKYSNFMLQCTMKKGFYYSANLKVEDSFLPLHLFGQQLKFSFQSAIKGKISNKKGFVEVFSYKINGIVF